MDEHNEQTIRSLYLVLTSLDGKFYVVANSFDDAVSKLPDGGPMERVIRVSYLGTVIL